MSFSRSFSPIPLRSAGGLQRARVILTRAEVILTMVVVDIQRAMADLIQADKVVRIEVGITEIQGLIILTGDTNNINWVTIKLSAFLLLFPLFTYAQEGTLKKLKCIRVKAFIKYSGDRERTFAKPMCACYDEAHKKFGLESTGEKPVLFNIENLEITGDSINRRISFSSAPYGVNVGRGDCDVQILESKNSKSFVINFSLGHYGYILQSKSYSKDTAFKITVRL